MAALGTVGAVKAVVSGTVFKRAQEIAASEKLSSAVFVGDGLTKGTAECIGSSPSDVYVLSVAIDGGTAVGDCSCPAGKNAQSGLCKHAVALLLRRVQEIQETKLIVSESPPEEVVISMTSQIDDNVTAQEERKSGDRREAIQSTIKSTVAQGNGPAATGSKRALPAWMLGVVGSAAGQTQSSTKAKSNKRIAEPKLPRPPPPPTVRGRRSGQPLKISNESDKEEEDPGEVHDAGPREECPAPEVAEEAKVPETIDPPTDGAAARERRRLRALKKEAIVVADEKGNEEVKRTRGPSSRAVSKEVSHQPLPAAKRRRLAKKYVEVENSDVSENAAAQVDASSGFEMTDEDMLFLAQEQLEREKGTDKPEGLGVTALVEPIEAEKQPDSSQGRRSSSIFSMNRWKEIRSEGTGGDLSSVTDDLDLKTLKSYSLAASSQSTSQSDWPSLNAEDASAEPIAVSQDTHISTPLATGCYSNNTVTNNMLNIFFRSSLSQGSPKKVPAATSTPNASQDKLNHSVAEVGFEAATQSPVLEDATVAPTVPAARADLPSFGTELQPKKKTSLKDRVKMLLG